MAENFQLSGSEKSHTSSHVMNANNNTAEVTALSHNQEIRVKGFTYAQKITVGTIAGYAKQYNEDPEAAIARAKSFGHPLEPWTNQSPAVLSADYAGKTEELDRAAAATAAAPEIEDGQIVEIEGERFRVKVLGQRYSDPVKFVSL